MNDSIWERKDEDDSLSTRAYLALISLFTLIGIAIMFIGAFFTKGLNYGPHLWAWCIGYFVVAIIGILIANASNNPFVSFFGLLLITASYGLLIGPLLASFALANIMNAIIITTAIIFVMGVVGIIYPKSLENLGSFILYALLIGILGYFIIPISGFFGLNVTSALQIWDWVIVLLFCIITMYDFNRALRIPHTLDNAIDVAIAIYLDWVNIFIRLLRRK